MQLAPGIGPFPPYKGGANAAEALEYIIGLYRTVYEQCKAAGGARFPGGIMYSALCSGDKEAVSRFFHTVADTVQCPALVQAGLSGMFAAFHEAMTDNPLGLSMPEPVERIVISYATTLSVL